MVEAKDGNLVVMNRSGSLVVQDAKGRDRERYPIVYGARLKAKDGQAVDQGQVLVEWDPYTFPILTEDPGQIRFKDILEGVTVHEEVDEVTAGGVAVCGGAAPDVRGWSRCGGDGVGHRAGS